MIQESKFLLSFKKILLKSFSFFFLFTMGCTNSEDYPNLGDVGERPPFPSGDQIEQEKKELRNTQESLQQDRRIFQKKST